MRKAIQAMADIIAFITNNSAGKPTVLTVG